MMEVIPAVAVDALLLRDPYRHDHDPDDCPDHHMIVEYAADDGAVAATVWYCMPATSPHDTEGSDRVSG